MKNVDKTEEDIQDIIDFLKSISDHSLVKKREEKFGIKNTNGFGITHKDLNQVAKEIGKKKELSTGLFNSGVYEGKLICSKTFLLKKMKTFII